MNAILFKEARMINRGRILEGDLLVQGDRISRIDHSISFPGAVLEIPVNGRYLIPGLIDDQVHFREPGLDHKGSIFTESKAGVAGGVTTFMEMPNTRPPAITQELLEAKYEIASTQAWANYSFYMGTTNDNFDEVMKTDPRKVCGVKIFMGSSTGNMLVDDPGSLDHLFASCPLLIATHCEDEVTVHRNLAEAHERYGKLIPPSAHPWIRSREACFLSSSYAVQLAKKHNTRLHILHITTADEIMLFDAGDLKQKRITSEACVHHLYFSDQDYVMLGNQIKCNPAIKTADDRDAVFQAVLDDRIDVIATDHAPHTWEEKMQPYDQAPSGLPLVQHPLQLMLTHWKGGRISLERIVEKMCHAPAECFHVAGRGYLDEGMAADLVMLDLDHETEVTRDSLLYKCEWSPLEGKSLPGKIEGTWVNGNQVYDGQHIVGQPAGRRLEFEVRV